MTGAHDLLKDLAAVLGTAALTTVLFQRLRLPAVLGYLLAGMIVGPHLPLPLVADVDNIRTLSELGVILLMFSLGLEFSLRRLLRVGGSAGLVTLIEVSLMIWLGYAAGQLLGFGVRVSVFCGAITAISSTMIIARTFAEHPPPPRLRELVFGVLVFEDLAAILLLATLTAVAAGGKLSPGALGGTALRLGGFLVALVGGGMLIVPRAVRAVARLGHDETLLVASVALCFALALLAQHLGYSVALGAFLGGSLIAESGEAPRVEHLVAPLRDLFSAIFFVSVGMLIDPRVIAEHWPAVLVLTATVVLGKIVAVSTGAFLTGYGIRASVQVGMSLAQIGEFSFIIAGVALGLGDVGQALFAVAVAVSTITAFLTPWLTRASGPAAAFVDRHLPRPLQTFVTFYAGWVEALRRAPAAPRSPLRRLVRAIIVDAALIAALLIGGSLLTPRLLPPLARLRLPAMGARALIAGADILLILPFVLGIGRCARRLGVVLAEQAIPGAGERQADLGAAPRRALALALNLLVLLLTAAPLLALTQPFLPRLPGVAVLVLLLGATLIGLWQSAANLEGHARAGAQVIAEALLSGSAPEASAPRLEEVERLLPGFGPLRAVRLEPDHRAVGRTLAQLDLRGLTGATVLAIRRPGEGGADDPRAAGVLAPSAHDPLRAGDVLVLAGTEEAMEAAAQRLTGPRAG